MSEEQIAVRWAYRKLLGSLDYGKWHITRPGDEHWTMCGRVVPIGLAGTFFPETDEVSRVTCLRCEKMYQQRTRRLANPVKGGRRF